MGLWYCRFCSRLWSGEYLNLIFAKITAVLRLPEFLWHLCVCREVILTPHRIAFFVSVFCCPWLRFLPSNTVFRPWTKNDKSFPVVYAGTFCLIEQKVCLCPSLCNPWTATSRIWYCRNSFVAELCASNHTWFISLLQAYTLSSTGFE